MAQKSLVDYYYTVKVKGYKTLKTIAPEGKIAKRKASVLIGVPISFIINAKRGHAVNFHELPND